MDRAFYPRVKGKGIAIADQFIGPIIILACIFAVLEIFVTNMDAVFLLATQFFLAIFLVEFVLRIYLRGWLYFSTWGILDLTVIMVDVLTLVVIWAQANDVVLWQGLGDHHYVVFLRIARLARLLRLTKLSQLLKDPKHWLSVVGSQIPYVLALVKSAVYAAIFVTASVLTAVAFFDYDIATASGLMFELVGRGLKLEGLEQQLDCLQGTSEADCKNSGAILIFQAAALVVVLAVTAIITQFFVPEMRRISEAQRQKNPIESLSNHLVIVINDVDKIGILEEFIYIFTQYARKSVVVMVNQGAVDNLEDYRQESVYLLEGDVESVSLWNRAGADRSDFIVFLGQGELLPEDYPVLISREQGSELGGVTLVFIGFEETFERKTIIDGQTYELVFIPLESLALSIENSAWDTNSLQYALIQRLTEEFDDTIEFPEISGEKKHGDAQWVLAEIRAHLMARSDVELRSQIRAGNLLLYLDEGASESSEIKLISAINKVFRDPEKRHDINVFVYVQSLQLIEWNSIYSANSKVSIFIFAIELAAVLAIFHESRTPNAMFGWLSADDSKHQIGIREVPWPGQPARRFRTRNEIAKELENHDLRGVVVGLGPSKSSGPTGLIRVFKSDADDRRQVGKDDRVLLIEVDGAQ